MKVAVTTGQGLLTRALQMIILLTSLTHISSCQKHDNMSSDITNITNIINEAYVMANYNIDSAILLFDQAIDAAYTIKHDSLVVIGLMNKAINNSQQGNIKYADSIHNTIIYSGQFQVDSALINKVKLSYAHLNIEWGHYPKALRLCKEAIAYYERIHYEKAIIASNLFIANVYIQQLDYTSAMQALVKALDMAEKIDQKAFIAMAYSNMGDLYFKEKEYPRSIECYMVATENYELVGFRPNVAACYQSIGSAYIELGELSMAEKSLNKSGEMYTEIGMYSNTMRNFNSLGTAYKDQKKFKQALVYYKKALKFNEKTKIPSVTAEAYTNIGLTHYALKAYSDAENYYQKAHKIRRKTGHTDFRTFYFNMMNVKAMKHDWKNAYTWARKYESHTDSIFNIEKYETTEELRSKYAAEKKDLQLEAMHAEKERDRITILKNRIGIISLSVLLVLIILFAYTFMKQYHAKVQSYKELIKKNEELTVINTAKREKALNNTDTPPVSSTLENSEGTVIPKEVVEQIKHQLYDLIKTKFYTDTNLSLIDAANTLKTNTRYLSQIINDTFACNFPTFINQLRVEEAQRLLKDTQHDNFTIEVIGQNAGFKSKSAFNAAFKKTTGVTPSVFKKNTRTQQS